MQRSSSIYCHVGFSQLCSSIYHHVFFCNVIRRSIVTCLFPTLPLGIRLCQRSYVYAGPALVFWTSFVMAKDCAGLGIANLQHWTSLEHHSDITRIRRHLPAPTMNRSSFCDAAPFGSKGAAIIRYIDVVLKALSIYFPFLPLSHPAPRPSLPPRLPVPLTPFSIPFSTPPSHLPSLPPLPPCLPASLLPTPRQT